MSSGRGTPDIRKKSCTCWASLRRALWLWAHLHWRPKSEYSTISALRKFRVLLKKADLWAKSQYSVKSPIRDLVQWKQISIFCKKWEERLDQGEPWRTVASPGQAGVKSRKHKSQSWAKEDVCGLGRGLGIEQSVWREGAYRERSYWFGVWRQVARTEENLKFMSLAMRLCTAKMAWGERLSGLLVTGSIGNSRGWRRSLTRVAKENARWPFAEVTSFKIPFIDVFSVDKWQHGFCCV